MLGLGNGKGTFFSNISRGVANAWNHSEQRCNSIKIIYLMMLQKSNTYNDNMWPCLKVYWPGIVIQVLFWHSFKLDYLVCSPKIIGVKAEQKNSISSSLLLRIIRDYTTRLNLTIYSHCINIQARYILIITLTRNSDPSPGA